MMKPQFRIRTLLIVTAFAALLAAWRVDHNRLQSKIDELEEPDFSHIERMMMGVDYDESMSLESESEREN